MRTLHRERPLMLLWALFLSGIMAANGENISDPEDCHGMRVEPTSGFHSESNWIRVSGPCEAVFLRLGPTTFNTTYQSSNADSSLFVIGSVENPRSVPISVGLSIQGSIHFLPLGMNYTYKGRPQIQSLQPNALSAGGGTLLTVIGSYFDDVEDLRLTLRQLAGSVNSSRGMHVFPSVNYGPLECSVLSAKKMICITPALRLRSLEEFGSFEAEYQFGLTWDTRGHTLPPFPDNGGIHPSPPTRAPDVSFQLTVVELASIEEHQWSPYDQLTEEPLKIKVAWGAFQQEAEIYVGGTTANVTKRYHNLILFFPPDEKQIITSERHACRASAHVVEVRAGNTNRHVGCLQYAAGGDDLPSMLIAIAVSGAAVVLLVIALAITSCVVWGRKSSTEQSS